MLYWVITRFFFVATALISRLPASITPEILFLFHVAMQRSNQRVKCFEFPLDLYLNDVVTEGNASIQGGLTILAVQKDRTDAAAFSQQKNLQDVKRQPLWKEMMCAEPDGYESYLEG